MPDGSLSHLFSQRSFTHFWLARLLGTTSLQMLMVALAWHMYDITSSAWDLGLVGLFQFVPALLLTLPAGHLADRVHRGRIFAVCMAALALAALLLMLATHYGFANRALILGVSVLLGMTRAFQMPAQQALTPQLVPKTMLQTALTLSSGAMQVAIICGPALGGLLYGAGPFTVYAASAALLVLAAAFALAVRYQHVPAHGSASWSSILAGVSYVWHHKVILGATTLDLFAVLLGGATALLPMFAKDMLHIGPLGLGMLRSAPAAGALLTSVVLVRWPLQRKVGKKLLVSVAVFGLATLVFGLSHSFALSLIALLVTGAADNISVVTRSTLVQLETPNDMRGRVSAVNSIFVGASNQLGEFESGAVAAAWGPVVSAVSGGIGTVLVAWIWIRLFPELAQRDRMHSDHP